MSCRNQDSLKVGQADHGCLLIQCTGRNPSSALQYSCYQRTKGKANLNIKFVDLPAHLQEIQETEQIKGIKGNGMWDLLYDRWSVFFNKLVAREKKKKELLQITRDIRY